MKTNYILTTFIFLTMVLVVLYAYKPIAPMPPTNTDIITDTAWVLLDGTTEPQIYDSSESEYTSDLKAIIDTCDFDDLMRFYTNDTLIVSEGFNDCEDTLYTGGYYKWFFDANEDTINFVLYELDTLISTVLKLESDTFRFSYNITIDSVEHTNTVTYIPKNY